MSPYTSHRQRKYSRQIFLYGIILVCLVIFMATAGLSLLIKGTIFYSNLTDQTKKEQTRKNPNILGQPQFLDLPDATNSSQLTIKGSATKKMNIKIFVNDDPQKDLFLATDEFETSVVLNKGENSIYAILEDPKTKTSIKSDVYSVYYGDDQVKLDILEPSDGSRVDKEDLTIVGQTTSDSLIRINDLPTVVGFDGTFRKTVILSPGENKITIWVQNRAGSTDSKEITVTYEKD